MAADSAAPNETRLWTPDGFRDDEWRTVEAEEAATANGNVVLPLQTYLDLDAGFRADNAARLGVLLQPADAVEKIADHLGELPLVALAFPAFSDGRSFSKAQILRERYGFEGAVRAVGQVLVDQLPHMMRVGFNEFEISNPVLLKRLQQGRVGGLPLQYQPAAKPSAAGQAYSWRRKSL